MEHGPREASKSVLAYAVVVNEGGVGRRKNTCKSLEFKSKFRRQMRTPGLVKMKVATPTSTLPTPLKRAALWLLQIFMERFDCSYMNNMNFRIHLLEIFIFIKNKLFGKHNTHFPLHFHPSGFRRAILWDTKSPRHHTEY